MCKRNVKILIVDHHQESLSNIEARIKFCIFSNDSVRRIIRIRADTAEVG